MPHSRTTFLRVFISLCVLVTLSRLCSYDFNWYDDALTIHQNPDLNPPTLASVARYWTAVGEKAPYGLYIPLTYTVWAAEAKIAFLDQPDAFGIRLNPWVFHTTNVILHLLSALVIFEILRTLLKHNWSAAAGALLFALHPVQVEPVGWVSGTKDLLCGLFVFISIWMYLRFAQNERSRPIYYLLATAAFIAAMLSKPAAIVAPLIVLTLDALLLKRPARRILVSIVPWFLLAIPCAISAKLAQPALQVPPVSLLDRPLVAFDALTFYAHQLLLPFNLGVDYGRTPTRVLSERWIWFTWIVPAGLFALLWVNRKRRPELMASGAIFVAGVFPVLGFAPFLYQQFSTVADHYLYTAMLGPAMAFAYLVRAVPSSLSATVAAGSLSILSILSFHQARVWKDDQTLWLHTLEVNPRSFMSCNNLGVDCYRNNDMAGAERYFLQAETLRPNDPQSHENLSLVYAATGRFADAMREIEEEIRLTEALPPHLRLTEPLADTQKRLESLARRRAATTTSESHP